MCNKSLTTKCVWDQIENQAGDKRAISLPCLLKSQEIWNNDSPIKALSSDRQREHPTPLGQAAGTCPWNPLFLFCLCLLGREAEGGREEGESSCFYCEHNFLTNSFHESLGDLCLFIYLAPLSFLKSRLLRALEVRTAPVVAVRVALLASQLSSASRNMF